MKRTITSSEMETPKIKRCKFVTMPKNFDDAVQWLINSSPKFYLRIIDYKLGNPLKTRAKMSMKELQTLWQQYNPNDLVQRCHALFLIQSIYTKLHREFENLQQSVAPCNYYIGWDSAMVNTLKNVPITLVVKEVGKQDAKFTVYLQSSYENMYQYDIFILGNDISSTYPYLRDKKLQFYNLEEDYYKGLSTFTHNNGVTFEFNHWACVKSKTANNGQLFQINILDDFIAKNVTSETRKELMQLLPICLHDLVIVFLYFN